MPVTRGLPPGEPLVYVWADFVAPATNRRAEMDVHLARRQTRAVHPADDQRDNVPGHSSPAGMCQRDNAGLVGNEHGHAVGDGHRRRSFRTHHVGIDAIKPLPSGPRLGLLGNVGAVNLHTAHEPETSWGQRLDQREPTGLVAIGRIGGAQGKVAGGTGGRKRRHANPIELDNRFSMRNVVPRAGHDQSRPSATRRIPAPSAFNRS